MGEKNFLKRCFKKYIVNTLFCRCSSSRSQRNKFLLAPLSIFILCTLTTIYLVNHIAFFSGNSFLNGEVWRAFLFPFAHSSFSHFFENMLALGVASALALEVGLSKRIFAGSFLLASILLAFANLVFFPDLMMLGASVGIYAIFGAVCARGSPYIDSKWLFLIFSVSIFLKYTLTSISDSPFNHDLLPTMFHFFGFLCGSLIFIIMKKSCRKKSVLLA